MLTARMATQYWYYNNYHLITEEQEEENNFSFNPLRLGPGLIVCFIYTMHSCSANIINSHTGFKQTRAVLDKSSLDFATTLKRQIFAPDLADNNLLCLFMLNYLNFITKQ